jgi:hypothetical protein
MGGREVVAMCSASLEGVSHGAAAAAVPSVPAVPERWKMVALVAAIMLLCNADRVVMSVAVVPLAAQHGWSSSFVGIVQVPSPNDRPPFPVQFLPYLSISSKGEVKVFLLRT